MAEKKVQIKYILLGNASGDVYTKKPPFERKDGGKFTLSPDLTQEDLKWLYEGGHTSLIITQEIPETPEVIKTNKATAKEETGG